ncbi:MAG: hypothetical protein AB7G93_21090 [Bdellovibrionales bacterium]
MKISARNVALLAAVTGMFIGARASFAEDTSPTKPYVFVAAVRCDAVETDAGNNKKITMAWQIGEHYDLSGQNRRIDLANEKGQLTGGLTYHRENSRIRLAVRFTPSDNSQPVSIDINVPANDAVFADAGNCDRAEDVGQYLIKVNFAQ